MQKIQIRPMRHEDIPSAAALEKDIFSEPWSKEGFVSALSQDCNFFFVAVTGETQRSSDAFTADADLKAVPGRPECSCDKVVGYSGLYTAADEGEITNVAVAADYRCQGVGTALVDALKERARKQGLRQIFLEVRLSNSAAQSLYEKEGFEPAGIRKRFYRRPGEDALVMRCSL